MGRAPAQQVGAAGAGPVSVTVKNERVHVETPTLSAVLEKGFLISLESKLDRQQFISGVDVASTAALQLLYPGSEEIRIDESKFGQVGARQISATRAEFVFHSWDGDGVLAISADPATGALLIEPSGYSSRPGLQACRWSLKGIRDDLRLVAPFFQGVNLPLADALIRDTRWQWPSGWEAGFAVLLGRNGGFWVHCRDDRYRYKALKVGSKTDAGVLGFDTEAYGPLDDNISAGGLCWRVNTFHGDWTAPAGEYRDWLWKTYGLDAEERRRAPWTRDVNLALSWCPGEPAILDALAKRANPRRVLIHYPDWRTDPYDENYPTFVASPKARVFLEKGRQMGFHIMPHCNSIDTDPNHPAYSLVRDFQYRDLERRRLQGWSWYQRRVIGVPESNTSRLGHRDKKVMVKIHPGSSMWRSILAENIQKAARDLSLETVFIDVTLTTFNLHNSLVENMTSTEGMKRLIEAVGSLENGLVVGGEGLNEITAQGQSFAQAHLFKSWQENTEGVERSGGCALNEFLFGGLCRTFGYSGLGGRTPAEELRMRLHEEHRALPTVTIRSAEELVKPNAAVKRVLERAAPGA
ncbi:MAG TPA: DUF6259 domain-containing protein [Bryobacteraceae bacterium]|nr:DUF6259 domain-containing protein [Bryobacteraceae bacterium]